MTVDSQKKINTSDEAKSDMSGGYIQAANAICPRKFGRSASVLFFWLMGQGWRELHPISWPALAVCPSLEPGSHLAPPYWFLNLSHRYVCRRTDLAHRAAEPWPPSTYIFRRTFENCGRKQSLLCQPYSEISTFTRVWSCFNTKKLGFSATFFLPPSCILLSLNHS